MVRRTRASRLELLQQVCVALDASQHATLRFNIGSIENRAVFEIPDIIESLMSPAYVGSDLNPLQAQA